MRRADVTRRRATSLWVGLALMAGTLLATSGPVSGGGYPPTPVTTVVPSTLAPVTSLAPATTVAKVVPTAPSAERVDVVRKVEARRVVLRVGSIALTGVDILRWVIFASALIAAGAFLVMFNRRRARA